MRGRRDVVFFFAGQLTSRFGDSFRFVAVPWLVLQITGSPVALGLAGAATVLPYLLVGLIGGVVADRADRRRVMIFADLVRAAVILAIPMLIVAAKLEPWHIYAAAFLTSTAGAFFDPAETALLPMIARREELMRLNAAFAFARQLLNLAGAAAAGVLVATVGAGPALVVDSVSFAIAALASTAIRPMKVAPRESGRTATRGWLLSDLRDGLRFVARNPVARALVLLTIMFNAAHLPTMGTFLPLFVADALRADAAAFGVILSADSAGLILGFAIVIRVGTMIPPGRLLAAGVATLGMGVFAFGLSSDLVVAMVIAFLTGIFAAATNPSAQALLQGAISSDYQGRVSALMIVGGYLLAPIAMTVGAAAIEQIGLRNYYLLNAVAIFVLGLWLFLVPSVQRARIASG